MKENIEALIKRRIKDGLFDDVVRRVNPDDAKAKDDDEEEILNFKKSKLSLGDVYGADYEKKLMGETNADDDEGNTLKETKDLFKKVMWKLT